MTFSYWESSTVHRKLKQGSDSLTHSNFHSNRQHCPVLMTSPPTLQAQRLCMSRSKSLGNKTSRSYPWMHSDTQSAIWRQRRGHIRTNSWNYICTHSDAEKNTHLSGVLAEWQDFAWRQQTSLPKNLSLDLVSIDTAVSWNNNDGFVEMEVGLNWTPDI